MSLKRRWHRACSDTIGNDLFWRIAVDHLSIEAQLRPLIERYAKGRILDAGAGRLAWRSMLQPKSSVYIPTDYDPTHEELAFLADLQGGLPLRDQSVDTIFCCSVMEHTTEPWRILPEFHRVLSPGGHVILSVPFLYYLHGAPHDYFRFTVHGITKLAHAAGFEVVECRIGGGLAHTVGQAFSLAWTGLVWNPRFPWLSTAPVKLMFKVALGMDRLDRSGLFAQTVNLILRRKTSESFSAI